MSKHATSGDGSETRVSAQNRARAREGGIDFELPDIGRKLSRGERGLLATLLNPEYFAKRAADRAAAAGISIRRYHEIVGRADFARVLAEAQRSALRTSLAPIIAASIETASTAGADGYQDRAMLLQMAGLHLPKQQADLRPASATVGVVGISLDEL